MRTLLRHLAAFCATLGLAFALAAHAAEVSKADAQKVRAVIEAQLAAFAADDAARAFSYAAPGIRETFGTPERFLAMVRAGYPAVYRAAGISFLKPEALPGELVQTVQLTDANGSLWLAVYHLQRQPDASWRISGVEVARNAGRAT
jgi:hypothetical protein